MPKVNNPRLSVTPNGVGTVNVRVDGTVVLSPIEQRLLVQGLTFEVKAVIHGVDHGKINREEDLVTIGGPVLKDGLPLALGFQQSVSRHLLKEDSFQDAPDEVCARIVITDTYTGRRYETVTPHQVIG